MMRKKPKHLAQVQDQVELAKVYEGFVQTMIGIMAQTKEVKPETVDHVANRLRELLVKYGDKVLEPFALITELHLAYAEVHMLRAHIDDLCREFDKPANS
jgi:hypothetical protein